VGRWGTPAPIGLKAIFFLLVVLYRIKRVHSSINDVGADTLPYAALSKCLVPPLVMS